MNDNKIVTDNFVLKKHNLRIFRVTEQGTATILWTTEKLAARYVQRIHIQKLLADTKRR